MKKLSKRHIVNKFVIENLIGKDFVIFTSQKKLLNFNLYKKSLIKYILPCIYKTYKKDFIFTYINFIDLTFIKTNLIFVYKTFVFKNNFSIFKDIIKNLNLILKIKKFKKLIIFYFLYVIV